MNLSMSLRRIFVTFIICFLFSFSVYADDFSSWAMTPPMGWNSWDCYGPTVVESEVKANADYMSEELKQYGWEYIVVDIRWYVSNPSTHGYKVDAKFNMDEYGRFTPAVNRFPSATGGKGFKELAEYVHEKGLKFGIHIMRGIPKVAVKANTKILGSKFSAIDIAIKDNTCPWLGDMNGIAMEKDGAQDYLDSLFELYAEWGVDYVKIDDCSRPYYWHEIEGYRKAIDRCGRKIVLSLSPGEAGYDDAEHVIRNANLWRISDDFWDHWDSLKNQFARCHKWEMHRRVGNWPDADMLPMGRIGIRAERGDERMTGFTEDEQITLMTLWSIFQSPLMFGGDLPSNDELTLNLITNQEVLDVNQKGINGRELSRDGDEIVWVAESRDSEDRFIAIFNAGENAEEEIAVNLKEIGFNGQCKIRDLWNHRDIGVYQGEFKSKINKHGAGLYRVMDLD